MSKAYHYLRWRWWNEIDIEKLVDELRDNYRIEEIEDHGWDLELTLGKEFRDKYLIKSDTLTV